MKHGGTTVDPAKQLIEEGLGLWFPHAVEWPWNETYSRLAERARLKGIGIWNPNACGPAPAATIAPPRMKVKWDGGGIDGRDPNSEWTRITNTDSSRTLLLGGWWFRDSHLRRYTFPRNAAITPGESIRVHPGNGPNDEDTFHWGLGETVFENASRDRKQMDFERHARAVGVRDREPAVVLRVRPRRGPRARPGVHPVDRARRR